MPFFLEAATLVADAFAGDFPLELGEGEQRRLAMSLSRLLARVECRRVVQTGGLAPPKGIASYFCQRADVVDA